jgi:colicin import membrane protein
LFMQAQHAARERAHQESLALLASNKQARAAAVDAKRREAEQDVVYAAQFAEILAKEEKKRADHLGRIRAIQAAQAEDAAARPEYKRYVDEALVERQRAQRAAAEEAAAAQRREAVVHACSQFRIGVAAQLAEKQAARAAAAEARRADLREARAAADAARKKDAEARAAAIAARCKLRAGLDEQVERRCAAGPGPAMSEVERKMNRKLLERAETAAATRCSGVRAEPSK